MKEIITFEKEGYIFEVEPTNPDNVTIVSHSGLWGHSTTYYNNIPVIANEKVICIPESVIDKEGHKYIVTSISRGVFDSLTEVEEIYIPKSIKKIAWSFWLCTNLKKIHVDLDNQDYEDVDGVLHSKGLKKLIAYPCNYARHYKVRNGVNEIANMAFKSSKTIEEIELPKTLRRIGINVFYGCVNLKHVFAIPNELRVFELNSSNRPITAIFHYRNKEWSLRDILNEFNKDNTQIQLRV